MKNYYEILQVSNKADKDTISKVYKYLIKKNHPDLFSGEEKKQAEIKVTILNEAYEVLSNDIKRKEFDEELEYYTLASKNSSPILKNLQEENERLKEELFTKTQILNTIYSEFPSDEYGNIIFDRDNRYVNTNFEKKQPESIKDYFLKTVFDFFLRIILLATFILLVMLIASAISGKNILFS